MFLLLLFLLLVSNLSAKDEERPQPITAANIEKGISTLVNGCVSVITGDYIESHQDLIIAAPQPLVFERYYASSDYKTRLLGSGWRHNQASFIVKDPENSSEFFYVDRSGQSAVFAGSARKGLAYKKVQAGFTNCGSGLISARTHPKNTKLSYNKPMLEAKTASGSTQRFQEDDEDYYSLQSEKHLNLCKTRFTYDSRNRVKKIQLTDWNDRNNCTELGSCWFEINKHHRHFRVYGSDGRSVYYKLKEFKADKEENDNKRGYIEEVRSDHAPLVKYAYSDKSDDFGQQIVRRELPENRIREIEYYRKKDKNAKGDRVSKDFINKVKSIREPAATNGEMIETYNFVYHHDHSVDVYDASRHKTKYHCRSDRLSQVETFAGTNGNYVPYQREHFVWGEAKGDYFGNLLCTRVENGKGQMLKAQIYYYDLQGNVVGERFCGNITGKSAPLILEGALPKENGYDCYIKSYKYSPNNLVTDQIESNGLITKFTYLPNTDLVDAQYTVVANEIKKRTFNAYDSFGNIIETIVDDGSTQDKNNLRSVTERKITRITRTVGKSIDQKNGNNIYDVPFGLPKVIQELYVDLQTGKEKTFSKKVNSYTQHGYLFQEQFYDSNDLLRYAITRKYDNHGNIVEENDSRGILIVRKHNENDELIFEQGPTHVMQYRYNKMGQVVQTDFSDISGTLSTGYVYDLLGNKVIEIDPFGNQIQYVYDEFNREIKVIYPYSQGNITEIKKEYDVLGNITCSIDQEGNRTRTQYNVHGKPIQIVYANGAKEAFEYNLDGTLKRSVGKNGLVTQFTYDYQQRITKKEHFSPQGELLSVVSNTYNAFHLLSSKDAEGIITEYVYDFAGRLVSTKRENSLTTYAYDELGRQYDVKEWINPSSYKCTQKQYDLFNRVVKELVFDSQQTSPLRQVEYSYDIVGNLIAETHFFENGKGTNHTQYNGRKLPLKTIDPEGNVTHFEYNYQAINSDNQRVLQTTVTDPLGIKTITTYTPLNQVETIEKKNSLGHLLSKQQNIYTPCGNVQKAIYTVISPKTTKLIVNSWKYNSNQHPIEQVEAEGTQEQKKTTFTYNFAGQQETIAKPHGVTLQHKYDYFGRLILFESTDQSFSYKYLYDKNDNLLQAVDQISGLKTVRTYDSNNRMILEVLANGQTLEYAYDWLGRPLQVVFSDQTQIQYQYDAANLREVKRIANQSYTHTYESYDLSGNVLGSRAAATETKCAYDSKGRLVEYAARPFQEKLKYDCVGNVIERELNKISWKYAYDQLNQIKSEEGTRTHKYICDSHNNCICKDEISREFNHLNQLQKHGEVQFIYDASGRLVKQTSPQSSAEYKYDALDRLVKITENNQSTEYTYDAFNRRLTKQKDADYEAYLYQGQNEVGAVDKNGKIFQLRVLGVGKGAEIGATIYCEFGGKLYVPLHDSNGNTVALLDEQGNCKERMEYSAFGEETIKDDAGNVLSSSIMPWRFSSKRVDEETKFVNFGRRYYHPETMRWITPDPIGFEGGPNLYAYLMNNPLNHIDLYGLLGIPTKTSVRGFLSNLFTLPGRLISFVSRNFLPIPLLSDITKGIGTALTGRRPGCHNMFHERRSTEVKSGQKQRDNVINIFVNGMFVTYSEFQKQCSHIAEQFGNEVTGCWNSEHGLACEIGEWGAQKIGMDTDPVNVLVGIIRQSFDKIGDSGRIEIDAHSQGGLITKRAIEKLNPREQGRISVYTYGSAQMIFAKDLQIAEARNYVSCRDAIPFISDPIGCIKGWWRNDGSVKFLPSKGYYFADHAFGNETYQNAFNDRVKEFKKTYVR